MPGKKVAPIPHWNEIQTDQFRWINLTAPHPDALAALAKEFPEIDELDLQDCLPTTQQTKLVTRPHYHFLILLFPVFHAETGRINIHEVDFFIFKKTIITVHDNAVPALPELFNACADSSQETGTCIAGKPITILTHLVQRILMLLPRMLVHINGDLLSVSDQIFVSDKNDIIMEILRIKTNIVNFRQAMNGHTHIMQQLTAVAEAHDVGELNRYLENLTEKNREIWEFLSNYKETIDAIHESHQSVLQMRSEKIMRLLTIIIGVTSPLIMIAALFAMHTKTMPFVGYTGDFWVIMTGMVAISIIILVLVKRQK